jgi:hypothetical protein
MFELADALRKEKEMNRIVSIGFHDYLVRVEEPSKGMVTNVCNNSSWGTAL